MSMVIDIAGMVFLAILSLFGLLVMAGIALRAAQQAARLASNFLFDLHCAHGWMWCLRALILVARVRYPKTFNRRRGLRIVWEVRKRRRRGEMQR